MEEELQEININEFEIEKIPLSCTIIAIGAPKSGKGTLLENIMYFNKHRVPVARVFTGSESQYFRFKKVMHPLYISNYYNQDEENQHIFRQRTCTLENRPQVNAINIIDDAGDDPKVFKSKTFKGLFKIGSQHWNQIFALANQYAIDFEPSTRKSVTFVFLFREPDVNERKKLYENFGGICGSYEIFCALMDQITGDFTALVIHKTSQSNKLEDCVFWYRTKLITTDWKFGSKEYNDWGNNRYNKDYKEKVIM